MKISMAHLKYFYFNSFQERCTAAWDEDGFCVFTDPGAESPEEVREMTDFVAAKGLKPVAVMLTHAHFDHIYGVNALVQAYGIPVYMHEKEIYTIETANPYMTKAFGLKLPDSFKGDGEVIRFVKEGDSIEAGSMKFEVLETPGHSPGGICFHERQEKVLFSGDTLFAGAIGRTDHPGGDYDMLMKSIFEKLLHLEGDTKVIPGHGPDTEIATERMTNPFLMPFNEPYEE